MPRTPKPKTQQQKREAKRILKQIEERASELQWQLDKLRNRWEVKRDYLEDTEYAIDYDFHDILA